MIDESESRRGLRPVGESLARALQPLLGKRSLAEAELLLSWPQIVGAELAGLAEPRGIAFPRRGERLGGTLTLVCDGAAALELQHRAPQILERINGHFGYAAVARLAFRQRGGRAPGTAGAKAP